MNKKKKKLGILAKIENNYFSTTNYVKPITPTVNLSLNSRDFSVKSTVEIVGWLLVAMRASSMSCIRNIVAA